MNLQARNLWVALLGQDVQLLQSELQKSAFGKGTREAVLRF
jgi:hypothetical protein